MEVSTTNYHFSGWATCCNKLCSDGRTIMADAFKHQDGAVVPLVWNHQQNDVDNILGKALLHSRDGSMYTYCLFNDTESGRTAKELVEHGDICSLSIHANQLKHNSSHGVTHGVIREVSLVLAGANPGAFIDSVIRHGEETDEEAIIYTGEEISMYHSDESGDIEHSEKEEDTVSEETKKDNVSEKEKTIKEVYDDMSEEQKTVVHAMVAMALEGADDDDDTEESEGGNETMKQNAFDNDNNVKGNVLTHSDQVEILKVAKSNTCGSFQAALAQYTEENTLEHAAEAVSGFQQTSSDGSLTVDALFPEYKDLKPGAPELITNDQGWVSVVMSKVHKSPIARIRTGQVDIRNIEALRAKGYKKGDPKTPAGNFKLVRRTTDPQTIYVKNVLHKDDINDIEDFDYVQYLYNIDRMNLNEELATAIMFGDGRDDGDDNKIAPDKIRPIWLDDDLYTLHVDIDVAAMKAELQGTETGSYFGDNFVRAEALINKVLYARENFKGSGTPDCFIHPHELNVMLLARDRNGHRMYSSKSELAAALNVGNIYTVEQMQNKTRTTSDGKTKKLLCIIANLSDYHLGATKGGQIAHFTQFDIDFNQQKSLLETRCSGALTKVYSAIAIEEPVEAAAG